MSENPRENAVEVRRRLLKGALGASTVATLGYGGAAAAASISCIAKFDGGAPGSTSQFTTTEPTMSGGTNWGWVPVTIQRYQIDLTPFDGFNVAGNVYDVSAPGTVVIGATGPLVDPPVGPAQGWVLAYFDDNGNVVGTYPTITIAGEGQNPAAQSCVTSINPGVADGITFGG